MIGKIKAFVNDVVKEMKKVSWPSKEQLSDSTTVVIVATIIFTFIVLAIDKVMDVFIKTLFS